ncbi:hypothetical protein BA953_17370 [Vibrio coralliilyticus]|uniref:DUF1932 domain-containing protein n=1 Tax=Vibrio coralliilyticus TaxID=190893 RepID=UPI0008103CA1|nr:NAD(P)-dependent oxidoreductase [Vibrio coralliilyticus]ANW25958.1 hypothetical protein BA953_17370 [Vibrio coralliilyticus]
MAKVTRTAFIGFGEAAKSFIDKWQNKLPEVISAYDIKTRSTLAREAKLLEYIEHHVQGTFNASEAIIGAQCIFSLVTPSQAQTAVDSLASELKPKQWLFDCNSCAPEVKKRNASTVESYGANYVDVAIMAPVKTQQAIPLNISGRNATEAVTILESLGFDVNVISDHVGDATTVKMVRSVFVKGLEALTAECALAAHKSGLEQHIFSSLAKSYPGLNINSKVAYNLERMASHGIRRSEELSAVANTLESLEIEPKMTKSALEWHDKIGKQSLTLTNEPKGGQAQSILAALYPHEPNNKELTTHRSISSSS